MLATSTSSTIPQPQRFLLRRRRGWIGVDVGSALTKMAQVERIGEEYRISARWCLPAGSSRNLFDVGRSPDNEFALAQQLRRGKSVFRGRRAAAAMSAGCTTHRYLDLPPGGEDELRRMIGEEIEADAISAESERCFDFWQALSTTSGSASMVQLSVIDIDRDLSLKLARNLSKAGLDCRLLDGVPCALARAAQMFDPRRADVPRVVLDIGFSSTVFVAVLRGAPVFTRMLRGCGLDAIIQPIQSSLGLTANESLQLVRRMGMTPIDGNSSTDAAAQVVHQLVSEPLTRWTMEVRRTLEYLQHSSCALVPEHILLTGGGSCLPLWTTHLANETGLEVAQWRLSAADVGATNQDDSLYAVAAALSALAWET